MNRIKFAIYILTDCVKKKGEQWFRYKIVQWNNKGAFDIFNDISDHVTLVQLERSENNYNIIAKGIIYV